MYQPRNSISPSAILFPRILVGLLAVGNHVAALTASRVNQRTTYLVRSAAWRRPCELWTAPWPRPCSHPRAPDSFPGYRPSLNCTDNNGRLPLRHAILRYWQRVDLADVKRLRRVRLHWAAGSGEPREIYIFLLPGSLLDSPRPLLGQHRPLPRPAAHAVAYTRSRELGRTERDCYYWYDCGLMVGLVKSMP